MGKFDDVDLDSILNGDSNNNKSIDDFSSEDEVILDDLSELDDQEMGSDYGSSAISPEVIKKICIIVGFVVVIIILLAILFSKKSDKDADEEVINKQPVNPIAQEDTDIKESKDDEEPKDKTPISNVKDSTGTDIDYVSDEIIPGLIDFKRNKNNTTFPYVFDPEDFIKDLNGSPIPAIYSVKKTTYEDLFVNYESRRAILDDGMEMYWLEITYEEKQYRCQVPFSVYKAMNPKGICVVQAEVLTLEDGEIIISYMTVNTNYKDLLK